MTFAASVVNREPTRCRTLFDGPASEMLVRSTSMPSASRKNAHERTPNSAMSNAGDFCKPCNRADSTNWRMTVQLAKNMANIREANEEDAEPRTVPVNAKVEINETLFRNMPPETTLSDLEDFATAIWATISDAWNSSPRDAIEQLAKRK